MSGLKDATVTVRASELNNLRRQADQAASAAAQNAILNRMNAALVAANSSLERRINAIDAHNRNTERAIANCRAEVRQAVQQAIKRSEEAVRAAKEEARRTQEQISRVAVETQRAIAETNRAIEESNRRVNENLRRTENRLNEQIQNESRRIDSLSQSIDLLNAGNAELAEMAGELFTAAGTFAENARDFPHGVAIIGGMKPVQESMDRARESIQLTQKQPMNAAAARQTAVDAFVLAQDFYNRAAAAEETWALHELAARQSVEAAAARLESTRTLHIEETDENGSAIGVDLDVDHWSDGELTALNERIRVLDDALGRANTLEDLDGIRAAADRVSAEIADAAASANIAAHESQNRCETAQDFADSLADHGMQLVGHGFDRGDMRGIHRIHMRDALTGDEVVITQTPTRNPDGSITTHVEADLLSDTLSGETFERRGRDMYATLCLGADDRHDQTAVRTVPGYETRPSDRRDVVVQVHSGGSQNTTDRGDIQSRPAN